MCVMSSYLLQTDIGKKGPGIEYPGRKGPGRDDPDREGPDGIECKEHYLFQVK